jgi:multidrug/hemolysin transport system permease protein
VTLEEVGIKVDGDLLDGLVGGQLFSSLLAVSSVTVSFCANMLVVQDRAQGRARDIFITPVKRSTIAFGYYIATTLSALIISFVATAACLIYLSIIGFYMSVSDVLFIILDVILMVSFGTALSSVINFFLSTEGQISAVGSIVSSCYGFLCGAYMPLSQLSDGLKNVISLLPGTYGTSLFRKHAMSGAFDELSKVAPKELVDGLKESVDFDVFFFGEKVSEGVSFLYLTAVVLILISIFVLLNIFKKKEKK